MKTYGGKRGTLLAEAREVKLDRGNITKNPMPDVRSGSTSNR